MNRLFSRLFRRVRAIGGNETLIRIVRTVSAYVWAWIAMRLAEGFGITFNPDESAAVLQAFEIFFGAVIYAGVAYFSKWLPILEYLLIVPIKPNYTKKPVDDSNPDSGS